MNLFPLLRFPGQVVGTVIDTVLTARAVIRHGERFAAWAEPAEGLVEFEAEHEVLPGGFSWGDVAGTYREALAEYCLRCGGSYTGEHDCLRDQPELMAFGISSVVEWMQENRRTDVQIQCGHCLESVGGFKDFATHMLSCTLSPASSASPPGAGANPEEVEPPPSAPSSGQDPSDATSSTLPGAVSGEGPVADSDIPPSPATGHPDLAELIAEVLAEHRPERTYTGQVQCRNPLAIETLHAHCSTWVDWREHVSVNIANRILQRSQPVHEGVFDAETRK